MSAATATRFPRPVAGRFPISIPTFTSSASATPSSTPPPPSSASGVCPKCGTPRPASRDSLPEDGQQRITELESQVKILSDKASAAADKIADYEDELRQLKSAQQTTPPRQKEASTGTAENGLSSEQATEPRAPTPSSASQAVSARISNLLTSRKSASNVPTSAGLSSPPPTEGHTRRESDLAAALAKEQNLRQKAEGQISQISGEMEELSAHLFQQANEMVATERKARAKLEERVEVLEKRDGEKRKRLERLEGAVQRIERVKGMLGTS